MSRPLTGGLHGNDRCGQATVFGLVEKINAWARRRASYAGGPSDLGFGDYSSKPDAWALLWTYRRLKNLGEKPTVGDLSLQNWGYSRKLKQGGNDYPFGYLFKSKAATSLERQRLAGRSRPRRDGRGRTSSARLARLVQGAYAKGNRPESSSPSPWASSGPDTAWRNSPISATRRRSIGRGWLPLEDLRPVAVSGTTHGQALQGSNRLGRVSGRHPSLVSCDYPPTSPRDTRRFPFYIPFRALTNRDFNNLLVAGKTMAQSFMANSATRLHPIEWSTGTAAGVAAALMARNNWTSTQAIDHITELQTLVRRHTPIDWTIDGTRYPQPDEEEYP